MLCTVHNNIQNLLFTVENLPPNIILAIVAANTVRLSMKKHLPITITILLARIMIKTMMTMPVNNEVIFKTTEHKALNKVTNSKLLSNFYRITQLKKVLKQLLITENEIKRIQRDDGMSLMIRREVFLHFLDGSTESRQQIINGEDANFPISENYIHDMEMKWFNRIY